MTSSETGRNAPALRFGFAGALAGTGALAAALAGVLAGVLAAAPPCPEGAWETMSGADVAADMPVLDKDL
ncbi:Hypothetical protein CAP_2356 [Chondromyces apiculatus DSM 436]|uniref:Uncharacterized protein n=1 Tax=Chondromyces apiculatus DSM 436 TaxID=1192034 RepID=A0A017TC37_9BACT|nr:Hypothetical protein CAP_2356 [Chondromyces apiculatus DSM 436]